MSPQTQELYRALLGSSVPLSSKQIASKLNVVPNSVYRLTLPLIEMGLVTKTEQYPYQFKANPTDEALSLFLLYQDNWFSRQFPKAKNSSEPLSFLFVQSRDELMSLSVAEVNKTGESVDLLRSGAEFPADLLLAMVKAKKRGVTIRMLIQDYSAENAGLIRNWKANGILVRKTPLQHVRLMLYDSKVVYFMSYRHTEAEKDLGLKIIYAPFAVILSRQFDQWWQKAEVL